MFQPFNRLGQETSTVKGTGIGLVVCKRLVELMAGTIGVESTEGTGSVFWIELDRSTRPHDAAAETTPIQLPANARGHTLLHVEENPANGMVVKDLVARRPDIRLLNASNASQGIEVARASLPDVILMDVNLPDISGVAATKILGEDPVTAHIPVVALNAMAIPRATEKGDEAGFFRYLTTPLIDTQFMDALDAALKFSQTESVKRVHT